MSSKIQVDNTTYKKADIDKNKNHPISYNKIKKQKHFYYIFSEI